MRPGSQIAVVVVFVLVTCAVAAQAAPRAKLWAKWLAHNDASAGAIDHSVWDRFLQSYVRLGSDGIARVPYARVTASHRKRLTANLARLAGIPISFYNRREQLTFWVDLYNELTMKLVLEHYPYRRSRTSRYRRGYSPSDRGVGN